MVYMWNISNNYLELEEFFHFAVYADLPCYDLHFVFPKVKDAQIV